MHVAFIFAHTETCSSESTKPNCIYFRVVNSTFSNFISRLHIFVCLLNFLCRWGGGCHYLEEDHIYLWVLVLTPGSVLKGWLFLAVKRGLYMVPEIKQEPTASLTSTLSLWPASFLLWKLQVDLHLNFRLIFASVAPKINKLYKKTIFCND